MSKKDIVIDKNQIIAFLHIIPNKSVYDIVEFGNFSEMGLPSTHSGIFLAILREFFENLSDPQKEKAIILFTKYRDIFSKMILI